MTKYIDKKVDEVVSTLDKSFTKLLINSVKEKFGVSFTLYAYPGPRLFLFRCNRRKYLRHIASFSPKGHFLPGWKRDKEMVDRFLSYGWSEKYVKDYMTITVFKRFSDYSIRLDKCTWLKASFNNNDHIPKMTLSFYGRNVTKWVYILQRTVLEYDENMNKATTLQRVVADEKTCDLVTLYKKTNLHTFKDYCIDEKMKDQVMDYINNTIASSKKIESKFKTTYAPGIMFYGAPGTGKSSVIEAIASELHAKVIYIWIFQIYHVVLELCKEIQVDN